MTKQPQKIWLIGLVIPIVLLIATVSSCGPSDFYYSVQVQAMDTGEDIPNAGIRVFIGEGKAPLSSTSDVDGFARILISASCLGQRAMLIVEATGYKKYTKEIDLIERDMAHVVQLEPEPVTPTPSDIDNTPEPTPIPSPPSVTPATPITPTSTPTLTPKPTPDNIATAIQGAGIFIAPYADSQQLGGVSEEEQVTVLGRSEYGNWFYIQNDQGVKGFTYAPRFEWAGDYESLPIVAAPPPPAPSSVVTDTIPPPASLELNLWNLNRRCDAGVWRVNVHMQAQGGNGIYTYYWNDEPKCELINESCLFELHSAGGAIVGTGKVVSGDGQTAEGNLYIPEPDCP